MTLNHSICLCAFFLGIFATAQEKPADYDHEQTVNQLRECLTLGPDVNILGEPDPGFLAYKKLLKHGTKAQITALLTDTRAVTRTYAFRAYYHRFPETFVEKAIPALTDHAAMSYMSYCLADIVTVSTFVFDFIKKIDDGSDDKNPSADISPEQKVEVVRTLVEDTISVPASGTVIDSVRYSSLRFVLKHWEIPPSFADDLVSLTRIGFDEAFIPLANLQRDWDESDFVERLVEDDDIKVLREMDSFSAWVLLPRYLSRWDAIFEQASEQWEAPRKLVVLYKPLFIFRRDDVRMRLQRILDLADKNPGFQENHLDPLLKVITDSKENVMRFEKETIAIAKKVLEVKLNMAFE